MGVSTSNPVYWECYTVTDRFLNTQLNASNATIKGEWVQMERQAPQIDGRHRLMIWQRRQHT